MIKPLVWQPQQLTLSRKGNTITSAEHQNQQNLVQDPSQPSLPAASQAASEDSESNHVLSSENMAAAIVAAQPASPDQPQAQTAK